MTTNVVTFPNTRRTKMKADARTSSISTIIQLDKWKQRPRTHRTANGVFFMTSVLTTTGDYA